MNVTMFSSWQVRCGIATYAADLVAALDALPDTHVQVVPYDRQVHPRADYVRWGEAMNAGDVAHIQHEYSFFGYLLPWRNQFDAFVDQIRRPLVITRHVTFDGPLTVPGQGLRHRIHRAKWAAYNSWLGPYARYLNKDIFARADRVIVLSARLKEHLVARGLDPTRIHVIPAAVPDVPPVSGGGALLDAWGWRGKRVLGIFGYITAAKGHLTAVEALARLPEEYVLLIAGGVRRSADQPVADELAAAVARLGLQARVRITGFVDDAAVPAHIDACDLLLFPATHADSSYSLITGLAYGRAPLIASDVYGHREVAERQAGIVLFPAGNAAALAQAVQATLATPGRAAELLAQSADYARRTSRGHVAERTREVYSLALADAAHQPTRRPARA